MNVDARRAVADLLSTLEPAHLGPGRRTGTLEDPEVRSSVLDALSGSALLDLQQQLVLASILLWHDHLDASHTISQGIETADGSFVHAMMHRREPDYWNSKYWWRQTGHHPAFLEIGRRAGGFARSAGVSALERSLLPDGLWKPAAFVDACESVAGRPADDPEVTLLRELQRIEFQVLLECLLEG